MYLHVVLMYTLLRVVEGENIKRFHLILIKDLQLHSLPFLHIATQCWNERYCAQRSLHSCLDEREREIGFQLQTLCSTFSSCPPLQKFESRDLI